MAGDVDMADKRIQAEKDYVKGMKYKEIADKYGVSINTVKSWKQRHGWERNKGAPSEKSVHTKKRGAPKGNINAKGNKGGSAPRGNSNAVTHGFFSKHLPKEAMEIIKDIQERSSLDMLWDQIVIQYAAIIRAQNIMYVESKSEMIKELKRKKDNEFGEEIEYEFQFAWDRHATYLNAQSRAMSTLQSMIKQYDELLKTELATEEQKARIAVLKSKVPTQNTTDMNKQIVALADLINNPAPDRVIEDD